MRILLVGAGASFSVADVETGFYNALQDVGVEVRPYALDPRIGMSMSWLNSIWRARGKNAWEQPTWPDIIYHASRDALDMARHLKVDWVVVISGMFMHHDILKQMREVGLNVAVLFTESPYDDEQQAVMAQEVERCWTTERTSVSYLRQFNPNTTYIRHAYDPGRHTPIAEATDAPAHDVVFVGSGWQERIDTLAAVDWTGIDLGLYGTWNLLGSRHRLRKYLRGGITSNDDATALYRNARIGLNLYRSSKNFSRKPARIEHAESMNPRAYELAACGVFQISDRRSEGFETFGESVPTFRAADDLEPLIRHYLTDGAASSRKAHARAARRNIEQHTFAARAAQLLADLEQIEQPNVRSA